MKNKNENYYYEKSSQFSGYSLTVDNNISSQADKLAEYVFSNSVSGEQKSVGSDGRISFQNLDLGIYLIMQTEDSNNYDTIKPFVITIPNNDNGKLVYDVDAGPKVGTDVVTTQTTEKLTEKVTKPDSFLPQTGELVWPIPLLTAGGLILFILGLCLRKPRKDR